MSIGANAKWLGLSQSIRVATQLIGLAIFSRLLSPVDFGVMAMAASVSNFALIFKDLGIVSAVIRQENLSDASKTAYFWVCLGLGGGIGLLLFILAPWLGLILRAPELPGVVRVIALSFSISGLGALQQALLERESRFRSIASIEVFGNLLGLVIGVVAAHFGAGVYALVAQVLTYSAVSTLGLWVLSDWRPKAKPNFSRIKDVAGFSTNLSAFNLVNYCGRNADTFIVGRVLGAASLGLYSVAYKLMLFPVQSFAFISSRVTYPAMSRARADTAAMRNIFLASVRAVSIVTAPVMAGLWVIRADVVVLFFGSQWLAVASLVFWMAAVGYIQSLLGTTGAVFMALGRTGVMFSLGVLGATLYVLAFFAGSRVGLEALAAAYLVANVLNACVCFSVVGRHLLVRWRDLVLAVRGSVICSACMALFLVFLLARIADLTPLLKVCLAIPFGAVSYVVLLWTFFREDFHLICTSNRGADPCSARGLF